MLLLYEYNINFIKFRKVSYKNKLIVIKSSKRYLLYFLIVEKFIIISFYI